MKTHPKCSLLSFSAVDKNKKDSPSHLTQRVAMAGRCQSWSIPTPTSFSMALTEDPIYPPHKVHKGGIKVNNKTPQRKRPQTPPVLPSASSVCGVRVEREATLSGLTARPQTPLPALSPLSASGWNHPLIPNVNAAWGGEKTQLCFRISCKPAESSLILLCSTQQNLCPLQDFSWSWQ